MILQWRLVATVVIQRVVYFSTTFAAKSEKNTPSQRAASHALVFSLKRCMTQRSHHFGSGSITLRLSYVFFFLLFGAAHGS